MGRSNRCPVSDQPPFLLFPSSLTHPCRLWAGVTEGIKEKNLDKATDAKSAIEDAQRKRVKEREEKGSVWKPRFFIEKSDGRGGTKFVPNFDAYEEEVFKPAAAVEWFKKNT